jgi:DDE family transposase
MSTTTKSPITVAQRAFAVANKTLRPFAHRFSPQRYTQPQLFACLALKVFFKTDYRGIVQLLRDLTDLRRVLGLTRVPHFTTLHKASQRLLRRRRARRLLRSTLRRFQGRRRRVRRAAFDSTGLDCGHASRYFIRRRSRGASTAQTVRYSRFLKLELSVATDTHAVLGVATSRGPHPDVDRFVGLLDETLANTCPERVVADAGYDSEPNHRYARRQGVKSFMPATHGRPSRNPPTGRYRRQMHQRLNKRHGGYGQRWQVETVNSMIKRRLATAVAGRSFPSQSRDAWLLALTLNLMLERSN